MAKFEQKMGYSLWCNNCEATRSAAFRTVSEGEPTQCPVCSSTDIDDFAIQREINRGVRSDESEKVLITTSAEDASKVSVSHLGLLAGRKIQVTWYCEVQKADTVDVYAAIVATRDAVNSIFAEFTGGTTKIFVPFHGEVVYEMLSDGDVTFSLMVASRLLGKEVSIRRARIMTEELPEGS